MTAQNDADQFLLGSGSKSASFTDIGDSVSGAITEPPTVVQQRDFTTGALKFWDDGGPMNQLRVTLQTTLRDDVDDDGKRSLYVKGQMRNAVADAVRSVQANGLQVGGTLTVTYTGDGEAKQRGMNPPKLYTATYKSPAATFLADQATPAAAPPAAAAGKPTITALQAAAMAAAGVSLDAFTIAG